MKLFTVGLGVILTIFFVVLKLTETIDWSWWYVFLPIAIEAVIGLVFFGICAAQFASARSSIRRL